MDLAASIGLFVMPIKFELSASGLGSGQGDFKFTAPLPVIGLRSDFAITPRWFLRTSFELFYLEYGNFKGGLADMNLAVEYNPWKNFAFGLGYENFRIRLLADGNDYPNVDFQGEAKVQFMGTQLYAKYFF
jgi:hypothetical protein